jgi:cytoskeleton protein RodZ
MSEASAAVGQQLKAERERKGLSAQRAADELHLDGWVIDALESGDYERLGPAVYAKGHLKRYASLLGLPMEVILEGFSPAAATAAAPQPATMRMRTSAPAGSELPWLQIVSFAAVALLIIGVLLWRPWHARNAAPPAASSAPTEAAASAAAEGPGAAPDVGEGNPGSGGPGAAGATPGAMVSSGAAALPAVRGSGDTGPGGAANAVAGTSSAGRAVMGGAPVAGSTAGGGSTAAGKVTTGVPAAITAGSAKAIAPAAGSAAAAGKAKLRLSFSADSWVDIHDAMGVRVYAGTGHANSVRTISGAAPLRVYLKSASGVQLEINNRAVAIGPQYVAGNAAHFEAGADGVLRRDTQTPAASAAPAHVAPTRNARPRG